MVGVSSSLMCGDDGVRRCGTGSWAEVVSGETAPHEMKY